MPWLPQDGLLIRARACQSFYSCCLSQLKDAFEKNRTVVLHWPPSVKISLSKARRRLKPLFLADPERVSVGAGCSKSSENPIIHVGIGPVEPLLRISGEDLYVAEFVKRNDPVRICIPVRYFHARRADGHPRNTQANDVRFFLEHPDDFSTWNVAFNDIAIDDGCVARTEIFWNVISCLYFWHSLGFFDNNC